MKCFTVTASSVTPKFNVSVEPYPHVGIGESGRGRSYARVPLGKRDFPESEPPEILERASAIKTRDKGTLLLVKEKPGDVQRALVLVTIPAGYRGGTSWTGVCTVKNPCKKRGERLYEHECQACGTRIPEYGGVHPDEGTAYDWPSFPPDGVSVLAEGYRAQGAAGRMGNHVERLLIMEAGTMFRVCRGGRLYGAPSKRYVVWTGEELKLGSFDELFPASPAEEEDAELL